MEMTEDGLLGLIGADRSMMEVLHTTATLALPDCWIGAGFVRAKVWDHLHGFSMPTPLEDVDVLYFQAADLSEQTEKAAERRLAQLRPGVPWSVKNQARMHLRNGDDPYQDTNDAMRYWLETPTCVAVGLDDAKRLRLLAPHGLDDLFNLVIRPTPAGRRRATDYNARVEGKPWRQTWPRITVHWA